MKIRYPINVPDYARIMDKFTIYFPFDPNTKYPRSPNDERSQLSKLDFPLRIYSQASL